MFGQRKQLQKISFKVFK